MKILVKNSVQNVVFQNTVVFLAIKLQNMKYLNIVLVLTILLYTSCSKEDFIKKDHKGECGKSECTVTTDDKYMDPNTNEPNIQVNILETLETGDDCNCIVSGTVKYRENGITTALVDYGNGDCDNWATITVCDDGDCDDSKAKCYKYEQSCGSK